MGGESDLTLEVSNRNEPNQYVLLSLPDSWWLPNDLAHRRAKSEVFCLSEAAHCSAPLVTRPGGHPTRHVRFLVLGLNHGANRAV
jgi:hypothetical protein